VGDVVGVAATAREAEGDPIRRLVQAIEFALKIPGHA